MTLISYTYDIQPGTPEDITQVMANFNTVKTVVNGQLSNENISPGAAIAYSKLSLAGAIVNADVAAAAAIAASKLAGYPSDNTKFLRGDGQWVAVAGGGGGETVYDKTTSRTIVNTASEADLLNSEITVGANVLGNRGYVDFFLAGDYTNDSGANRDITFRIKLGTSTLVTFSAGVIPADMGTRHFALWGQLVNITASTQYCVASGMLTPPGSGAISGANQASLFADTGSSSESTTVNKAFIVTAQHSAAHSSLSITLERAFIRATNAT